jgi:hypothetical protein
MAAEADNPGAAPITADFSTALVLGVNSGLEHCRSKVCLGGFTFAKHPLPTRRELQDSLPLVRRKARWIQGERAAVDVAAHHEQRVSWPRFPLAALMNMDPAGLSRSASGRDRAFVGNGRAEFLIALTEGVRRDNERPLTNHQATNGGGMGARSLVPRAARWGAGLYRVQGPSLTRGSVQCGIQPLLRGQPPCHGTCNGND